MFMIDLGNQAIKITYGLFSFQVYDDKDYRKIRFIGRQKEVSKRSGERVVSSLSYNWKELKSDL